MRIVDIREKTVSIASPIANAYIDFSKMTCSVVAVVTDVVREGKPVVGYGFNSNGRYGQGALMRDRFIARVLEADPETLVDREHDNLDPFAVWKTLMTNEKPGGHGERSVAVGTIDMAVWDAVAKIAGVPLWRLLADRYRGGVADDKVWVYAAGGYYYPGKDHSKLQAEMRSYLDSGYGVVKMKIGAAPLDEDLRRIDAVLEVVARAGGWPSMRTAASTWLPRPLTPRRSSPTGCSGTKRPAIRSIMRFRPNSPIITTDRWRRARTFFRIRMPATCCAMAGCDPTATSCNSTARFPTGWSNICAPWT